MRELATPEEALSDPDAPDLLLSLRCTACGQISDERFAWACVHPNLEACRAQGWDGVSLSRIVRCAKCAAVDAYDLIGESYLKLTAGVPGASARARAGRVIVAESRLWDGTEVRRPSQALGRLRELAAEHKSSAEAQRRLGNGCERFGMLDDAVAAWRRAVELDENELEALYSLAELLLREEVTASEGFSFLQRAVSAIPTARSMNRDTLRNAARGIFDVLRAFPENDEPLALMAGWQGGALGKQAIVHMSSVDLRDVLDVWDDLVDFAASPGVISLDLTDDLPEEEETQLLRLLLGGAVPVSSAQRLPVVAAPKAGRNAPCPCGSGKKFKRCCADKPAGGRSP